VNDSYNKVKLEASSPTLSPLKRKGKSALRPCGLVGMAACKFYGFNTCHFSWMCDSSSRLLFFYEFNWAASYSVNNMLVQVMLQYRALATSCLYLIALYLYPPNLASGMNTMSTPNGFYRTYHDMTYLTSALGCVCKFHCSTWPHRWFVQQL
jgi:hypothetical protein